MLDYCSRRIMVNDALGVVILILPEILTSKDQQHAMYSRWVEVQLARSQ